MTLIGNPAPRDTFTLADLLRQRAVDHGGKPAFTFVQDDLSELQVTYAQLHQAASAVAMQVSAHADRGARALLLLPPGPNYVIAFFGCLLASVVAVPCYPPLNRRNSPRVEGIARDCDAALALVAPGHTEKLKALVDGVPRWLEVDGVGLLDGDISSGGREPRPEDLCFLQYTSGSTGAPKGVRVTHRNLMANLEQIRQAFQPAPDFVGVSWLPPYHDMGLIGGLLEPVYAGGHHVILSPASFLQQPLRWLRYVSDHRAAYAGGPNFAFELCARRATEEHKAGLDLSSWRVAFCGAEPLRADTLERFVEAFAPCGFRREALLPCYGLAEATLLVAAQRADSGPVYRTQEEGRRHVGSGEPGVGVEVAIVDPSTGRRAEPGTVGEIWVAGDNVADGYWANEEATRQTFGAMLADEPHSPRFLRTGDLGSMHDGQLYVAGRLKDVLILSGRNVYPQDVEQASFNSHAGLRKDGAAVFAVEGEGTEEMVVVQELDPRRAVESDMIGSIAAAVFDETGVQPHAIVLVKAGGIPRTSSGKIRRSQCKAEYEDGRLPVLASRIAASQPAPSSSEPLTAHQELSSPRPSKGAIEAWLTQRLGEQLGVDAGAIDADQPFAFHGVSSLLGVQLIASLGHWLGRPLSPTLLWDHPSPSQLASHLAGQADRAESPAAVAQGAYAPAGAAVEPIAIVGLACRFPGADDAHEFWDLLHGGRDAVGPVPVARLDAGTFIATPDAPPHTRIGGFLRQVDQFDPHFFGISPVEAQRIDPQQRLVLEVAWEALEDAAIAPSSLAGSLTGVYVGISAHEYEQHQTAAPDAMSSLYAATGSALSVAPNRLSYLLDLRGPSMAVDTACSSSLVSLHLACQSLRLGETDLALAGGVNLILSDKASAAFAAAGMLSPDGRCKTFDEAADGYVRGEGCGVVVLKRLRDAQRDGDRVRAVILGSAVQQDGRSNGLVAPNGLAQAEVVRRALQHAGVSPTQIGYIEAHGTGTALGDPIEFNALKRVFQDGDAPPCAIGSVKSGIGHLEAAAGVAGVIKTVLSFEHETILPHLHHRRLNPNCSLSGRPLEVPTAAKPWPAAAGRRYAGVSSFGFGGTIAHAVLADAPRERLGALDAPLPHQVLPLSAKSPAALERMTDRLAQALRKGATSLADAAVTLQTGRDGFSYRRLLISSDAAEAANRLAQRDPAHVYDRRSAAQPAPVAFMFAGQGTQHPLMAWQLYRHVPLFREQVEAGLRALEPGLQEELRLALCSGEPTALDRTDWAQPALFIVEHAIARLWIECGIPPAAMIGHSLGEYVAACVAGVFTLEEGVALVAARGRLMQSMPAGAMLSVGLDEAQASAYLSRDIALAAINAPQRCVLAGTEAAVEALQARLAADGVAHRRLRTSHAFHSPAMDPIVEPFRERMRAVALRVPRVPYVSNLTGTWITPEQATDPDYWARQLREPVRYAQGLAALLAHAPYTLIDAGPGGVLGGLARQCGEGRSVAVLPSLSRDAASSADLQTMLTSLGQLWLEGHAVQWQALHAGSGGRRAALPTYPFERQRYWLDATPQLQPQPASQVAAPRPDAASPVAPAAEPVLAGSSSRDDVCAQLVTMVAELLRTEPEKVDPDVHFIHLGADSLLILQVVDEIERTYGVTLTMAQLFDELTTISRIAAYLAARIHEKTPEQAGRALPAAVDEPVCSDPAPTRSLGIEPVETQADYDVSAAQRRLWLLHQLDPCSTAYHVTALLELPAGVGLKALQSALSQVLARHESLRTVFMAGEGGMPRQLVQPAWAVEVSEQRIDDDAALQAHYERFIGVPFDLSRGPLFRAEVLHTRDGRQRLAWCMHEIIADGSSALILEREVRALLKAGEAAALATLPIQYKDFAAWQNRLLREEDASRQYWHEQFGGDLVRLELPYDHAPSAQAHTAAAQYPLVIAGAAHQTLLGLCKSQQVTLAMLLQAAMAAWLSRLTGSRDIVLAVPASGRDVSEVQPLIGFFLNTVLLRIPVDPEASFEQVLAQSRQLTVHGLQHQHYPFEQLIEELDLPRPQNQFPVTPVLFNVLNFFERGTLGEVPGKHQPKTLGAKAELEFTVQEHVDGLVIRCDYRTALFEPSTIEYLMQQLQSLLDQVGQAPARCIAALDVFADARVGQLRSPYLQFANALPAASALPGVLERFAQQAQRAPEATAIEWQNRHCSYAQLQAHSDRIARQLQALGCCTGDIVALLLPDPIEHVAAVLGTMKAGAVFMTLEASDPVARLQTLVARVAPRWWIAEQAGAEVLAQLRTPEVQGVWLGEVAVPGLTPLTAQAAPVVPPADADACYVFFTSGSTGQPKPILGRAASLAQFIDWEIDTFGLKRGCRVSQLTAPTFDAWLRDVFVPLCAGSTVCMPPQRKTEPDRLLAWLDEARVELVHCVPSLLRALLAYAKQADEALPHLASLRRVCLSGEPVLPALVQAWWGTFGDHIELVNFYGASETTMIRCWHRISAEDVARGFIPIGRPIAHTQAIVLDGQGQPCAPGTPGEIWLRSRYFTLGYQGDEARTAEVFVPNPLRPQDDERVYRSGDLGVLLHDGTLRCLGRRDGLVKVNGVRIEVGEIENAMVSHPQVREAAVIAHTGEDGGTRLIAHVVSSAQTVEDLHGHLVQRLPASLLPQSIILHEALPLTSSGKIDRKALAARDESTAPVQAAYLAPVTDTERTLAHLYGQVLGRDRIGRDDDFFALGGHSLQALMLLARIRKSFDMQLALRTLFETRTVRQLAETMDRQIEAQRPGVSEQENPGDGRPLSIPRRPADLVPPLSLQQQRLWFLDRLEPAGTAYNIAAAVQVNGPLSIDALRHTLNELVRRHEVLRTTFVSMDGVPVQVIAPSLELDLPLTDLSEGVHESGVPQQARGTRARALIDQEVAVPFDLATGPLVRARLLRLSEAEHIVLFTLHHGIFDGWSMGVLVREVAALYAAFVKGRPSPLQDLAIQYADYAHWQRQALAGDALQAQLDYWKQQLAEAPALLALPTDRPRPAIETHRGAVLRFLVPQETTAGLHALALREQGTLFMVLAAAFNVLLWRYSAQDDICIGTPVANRPRQELEPLIGCFVNALVLRTRLQGPQTFTELLRQVKATTLDAYAHQDVPFEQLVEVLNPVRDTGHAPLFQVLLTLQNAPMGRLELGGLQLDLLDIETTQAKFDLSLDFAEEGGQLHAELEYNTDLFDPGTIERLARHWQVLCAAIVADPDKRIAQLPLLGAAERQQLLVDWNDSAQAFPLEQTYAQLFARQVQADPERVAAVCGDESWSYGELDRRSQCIAQALRAAGAGCDTLVVLLGRRDLALMSLMVGVLKAGAAFLPLDVSHPVERLREIVQGSAARLLVATPSARELVGPLTAGIEPMPTCLAFESVQGDGEPAELARQGGPGSLAYVVYTSGSTGQPKGVAIEQRGMLNNMLGKVPTVGLCAADRVAQTASVAFDIAIWQFLAAPLVGACTCILDDETVRDPRRLIETVNAQQLSLLEIVPSALRAMLDLCGPQVQLPTLRWVLPTGEALPASLAQQWRDRFPRIGLMNLYGPAECSDDVAAHAVVGATAHGGVSIGRPTANNQVFILDQALQPVPVGVTGELCIGGTGVARGYLGRPELTAERFVPNPFGPPGSRMYRSGDLGRWLPDGTIEYVGRNDHQVKLRGFRIELGEIEACLLAQPGVREAATLVREDMAGSPRLVAYVVAHEGLRVDSQALREALQQRLPQYMVPTHIVRLDALPLTPNGKLDRHALPAPEGGASRAEYLAPRTPTEQRLAGIWAEVLGLERVGVHDDFFELGGHSLSGLMLLARIRSAFGVDLAVRAVFESARLEQLAAHVDERLRARPDRTVDTKAALSEALEELNELINIGEDPQ